MSCLLAVRVMISGLALCAIQIQKRACHGHRRQQGHTLTEVKQNAKLGDTTVDFMGRVNDKWHLALHLTYPRRPVPRIDKAILEDNNRGVGVLEVRIASYIQHQWKKELFCTKDDLNKLFLTEALGKRWYWHPGARHRAKKVLRNLVDVPARVARPRLLQCQNCHHEWNGDKSKGESCPKCLSGTMFHKYIKKKEGTNPRYSII